MTDMKPRIKEALDRIAQAARYECGADQALIAEEIIAWGALLLKKNSDYGGSVWRQPILAPDVGTGVAIRVRMSDKITRLQSLLTKDHAQIDETIEDTIRDLGAYCLLLLARPHGVPARENY